MKTELEAKFLDINKDELRELLKSNHAVLVHEERLMKRKNFDYNDSRLEKIGGWIRVRDEGDKTTLTYKQLVDRTLEGTKELEVVVENFDKISNLLLAIGLINFSYQETKRERWGLDGVEVTIDTWPWIPSFVELEGESEIKLKETAVELKLDWTKVLHGSVEIAYQNYFNVTEAEIYQWNNITFSPIPEWLELRRK